MIKSATRDRGTALVSSLMLSLTLLGIGATYATLSHGGFESSNRELALVKARLAADEGLQRAMAEIKSGVDLGGDGLGTLTFIGVDGRQVSVVAEDLGGDLFRISSQGESPMAVLALQTMTELVPAPPLYYPFRAAITAEGPVTTTGNITIDGRDWNWDGTAVVAPGVTGISSTQGINVNGASAVGGNGQPPNRPPPSGTVAPNDLWVDGVDNDGDGLVDEESFEGVDNDGDGEIDEDTNDYPTSPDILFRFPEGTLKAAAQGTNSYFANLVELENFVAAHGGNIPGGLIIYCDFDLWEPVDFGLGLNEEPSVLVHHNATGTALMKNIHGQFKGLVLSDFVEHINGDFLLLGGLMSFADDSVGNAFGNGNADIMFSSIVLGSLPAPSTEVRIRVLSYQRSATTN